MTGTSVTTDEPNCEPSFAFDATLSAGRWCERGHGRQVDELLVLARLRLQLLPIAYLRRHFAEPPPLG